MKGTAAVSILLLTAGASCASTRALTEDPLQFYVGAGAGESHARTDDDDCDCRFDRPPIWHL